MKRIIFTLFFGGCTLFSFAKASNDNYTDSLITVNTYAYFCKTVLPKEATLHSNEIYFTGKANQAISDIYVVADCIRDINMLKDSVPNRTYINQLLGEYSSRKGKIIDLNKGVCNFEINDKKDHSELIINSPVVYKDFIYQEYKVMNIKNKLFYTITIRVNSTTLEPIKYFVKKRAY